MQAQYSTIISFNSPFCGSFTLWFYSGELNSHLFYKPEKERTCQIFVCQPCISILPASNSIHHCWIWKWRVHNAQVSSNNLLSNQSWCYLLFLHPASGFANGSGGFPSCWNVLSPLWHEQEAVAVFLYLSNELELTVTFVGIYKSCIAA